MCNEYTYSSYKKNRNRFSHSFIAKLLPRKYFNISFVLVIYETEDLNVWLQETMKQSKKKITQQQQNYFLDTFGMRESEF